MKCVWKAANAVMLLAFLGSVVVQINDPDPWRWVAMYGAAAAVTALTLAGRSDWRLPAVVIAVAVVWAVWLAPDVIGNVRPSELFEAWEMRDVRVEIGREFGGLAIIVAWMTVLLVAALRARAAMARLIGSKGSWRPSGC